MQREVTEIEMREGLRAVRELIRQHPEKYSQREWLSVPGTYTPYHWEERLKPRFEAGGCGTTMCLAGWLAVHHDTTLDAIVYDIYPQLRPVFYRMGDREAMRTVDLIVDENVYWFDAIEQAWNERTNE